MNKSRAEGSCCLLFRLGRVGRLWALVIAVAVVLVAACFRTVAQDSRWPEDKSFVVLEDLPDRFAFEPGRKIEQTVDRVVLLPVVDNYLWNKKRHSLALADPLVVEPGKEPLRTTMACLETNRQSVRGCIVLARGHCPGGLHPIMNWPGSYQGKSVWLIELAKIPVSQFQASVQCITNELRSRKLRVGGEARFEEALKAGKLLSNAELLSPVVFSDGKYRTRYVLWSLPDGTSVSMCLSSNGWRVLEREVVEPAFKMP